jgi:hypothetical protein
MQGFTDADADRALGGPDRAQESHFDEQSQPEGAAQQRSGGIHEALIRNREQTEEFCARCSAPFCRSRGAAQGWCLG